MLCYDHIWQSNPNEAVHAFALAIAIYEDMMRNSQVARFTKEIAEIYEQLNDFPHAVEFYRKVTN